MAVGPAPLRFSQVFGINLKQPQLDFVDITPSQDTPLFIDPFAISLKKDEWSEKCHRHISHFFQTALDFVKAGNEVEARKLLNGLHEPNETCLGLSKGVPAGRGVAEKQALDLYESLAQSQAAKSGILEELAECDLFVPGIGSDKISDITTNIIRGLLIEYTHKQCELHNIPLAGTYPSGRYWDMENQCWISTYVPLPVVENKRIILVPKFSVRRKMSLDAQEYYSHHILNFIQEEEYRRGSHLVQVLKGGRTKPPTKKSLKEKFPFSKDFIARFSKDNKQVLAGYKTFYAKIEGARGILDNSAFDEEFKEDVFARFLIEELKKISAGINDAERYHSFIVGALEFVFWPNLYYPKKEAPINEGRKRIDITYTNAALFGFFYRAHTAYLVVSNLIMVECKNYSKDPNNPEVDQLAGRFSINRGKLGLLLYRDVINYELLCQRCKDVSVNGNGFVLPIGDVACCRFHGH